MPTATRASALGRLRPPKNRRLWGYPGPRLHGNKPLHAGHTATSGARFEDFRLGLTHVFVEFDWEFHSGLVEV